MYRTVLASVATMLLAALPAISADYPRQHLFNKDAQGRSYGLTPDKYHWALKKDGDAKKEADWLAIWPWEKVAYEKKGLKVSIGATPWK